MLKKIEAIEYDFGGDVFIDVGGNVGMWTKELYDLYKQGLIDKKQAFMSANDFDKYINHENKTQEGVFGINIHKAGVDSTFVENWSEGCQVFKKSADFDAFMAIVRIARDIHGNSFTYTLIESSDIA
jgi:hypothetical protein